MESSSSLSHKSLKIGLISIFIYVTNYCLRNVLPVLTPYMLLAGYTKEYVAALSSTYMLAYALGQLLNGFLGDVVSPKCMVTVGLSVAGLTQILFPLFNPSYIHTLLYFVLGFSLSMLRGPLMRVITGSTPLKHARIICVFFSASSFIGPLATSLLSIFFHWNWVFIVCGLASILMATASYMALSFLEKSNAIAVTDNQKIRLQEMFGLFKLDHFVYYLILSCISETVVTGVSFWIPTLLTEYVHLTEEKSNLFFSGITTCRMIMPFVTLSLFHFIGESETMLVRVSCCMSVIFLLLMFFLPVGWFTIFSLLLAMMCFTIVSSSLWSIYIPSLGKTGHVSAANGLLDSFGYFTASALNLVFAQIVTYNGWKTLILSWAALPAFLFLLNILWFGFKKKSTE